MTIVTYIWKDFANEVSSSYEFRRSVAHFGYNLINVSEDGQKRNLGEVLKRLYEAFKTLPPDEPAGYLDGADCFILRPFNFPNDRILYMTEKAIWPPTKEMHAFWHDHLQKYPTTSKWCYLNGGGYIGPAGLLCEFFEKTGLHQLGDIEHAHSQANQAWCYAKFKDMGGPIYLDSDCRELQSTGFADPGELVADGPLVCNTVANTYPAVFHGNGRTPISWLYPLLGNAQQYKPPYEAHKAEYETR